MPSPHSELEHKFAADHVSYDKFKSWAIKQGPFRYNSRSCPDIYYEQGDNTVRHRWSGGGGELTVKLRKSQESITDRVEVDLHLGGATSVNDVTAFLQASGWKRAFTLFKDQIHCFWYEVPEGTVSVAIYGVEKLDEATQRCVDARRFIEVEIEKDSQMSDEKAALLLSKWRRLLSRVFRLGPPLNVSLYEMYSGRNYKTAANEEQTRGTNEKHSKGRRRRRPVRHGSLRARRGRADGDSRRDHRPTRNRGPKSVRRRS